MHREHEYGNELELDWCGQQFEILDNNKNTGKLQRPGSLLGNLLLHVRSPGTISFYG